MRLGEWVYVTHGLEVFNVNHTHTQTCTHAHMHTRMHTHMHTHMHMCTHIHTCTHTDADGMLCQALLVGNFEAAVDICISADRMVSHIRVYRPTYVHLQSTVIAAHRHS